MITTGNASPILQKAMRSGLEHCLKEEKEIYRALFYQKTATVTMINGEEEELEPESAFEDELPPEDEEEPESEDPLESEL